MSRVHHEDPFEVDDAELNLTPYLDIITTLVIFMIFTFQVVIEFRMIDVFSPQAVTDATQASENNEASKEVSLVIRNGGHLVVAAGGAAVSEVPKVGDKYDYKTLRDTLKNWKTQLALGESIVISAEPDVEYAKVVETMDAIRRDDKGWLFPDVVLGRSDAMKAAGGTP